MFDHRHYVPILKWRQGEYQALFRLNENAKKKMTPLIEIPAIEWDFEDGCFKKTLDEHLYPVADRIVKKWGKSFAFIDAELIDPPRTLADGSHALDRIFSELRTLGAKSIPVTTLSRDKRYQDATKRVIQKDHNGVCVRLSFEDLAEAPVDLLKKLLTFLAISIQDIHFVIDLKTPNFDHIEELAELIWGLIEDFDVINDGRSLTLAGTAFPESMGDLKKFIQIKSRDEWVLYKRIIARAPKGARLPTFGDYAIAHPVLPREDMRLLKPSASVRYTVDDAWLIAKGKNVRDNGFGQYKNLCDEIVTRSKLFMGETFSPGDKYISQCASGVEKTGNLTTWRWVGTNHHLVKVMQDVSKLYGI